MEEACIPQQQRYTPNKLCSSKKYSEDQHILFTPQEPLMSTLYVRPFRGANTDFDQNAYVVQSA
uniref:Uncharacterized protein n=1 Tax=Megaselia scalaris TaxID=36166 RepID=T1GIU7_MEGSC